MKKFTAGIMAMHLEACATHDACDNCPFEMKDWVNADIYCIDDMMQTASACLRREQKKRIALEKQVARLQRKIEELTNVS